MTKYESLKSEFENITTKVEQLGMSVSNPNKKMDYGEVCLAFCLFCEKNDLKLFEFQSEAQEYIENNGIDESEVTCTIEEIKYFYYLLEDKSSYPYMSPSKDDLWKYGMDDVRKYLETTFGPTLKERKKELSEITMLIDSILLKRNIEHLNEEDLLQMFKTVSENILKELEDVSAKKASIVEKYKSFGLPYDVDIEYVELNKKSELLEQKLKSINKNGTIEIPQIREFLISLIGESVQRSENDIELFLTVKYLFDMNANNGFETNYKWVMDDIENLRKAEIDDKEYQKVYELVKEIFESEDTKKFIKQKNEEISGTIIAMEQGKITASADRQQIFDNMRSKEVAKKNSEKINYIIQKCYADERIKRFMPLIEEKVIDSCQSINESVDETFILRLIQEKINEHQSYMGRVKANIAELSKLPNIEQMTSAEMSVLANDINTKMENVAYRRYSRYASEVEKMVEYTEDYNEEYYENNPQRLDEDMLKALQQKYFESLEANTNKKR